MYFKLILRKNLTILPSDLDAVVVRKLEGYLRREVEGKYIPDVGLVVAVVDILKPMELEGKVLDSGNISFLVAYQAIVHRMFSGEVCDVIATQIRPEGFFASAGAVSIYVSKNQMPPDYLYESDGSSATLVKKDGSRSVSAGDIVRIRIIAETNKAETVKAIGSMVGDYLGPR